MTIDPVLAFESLGYTEREAVFLYLAAVHSGYFLRRQFNYFIDREKGYIAQHFVEKARVAGHVEVIDYGQGRFVYHLFSKTIYRLLGNAESQNRRRKGDSQIRARLMALDYFLENNGEHYLETDEAKRNFFLRTRSIQSSLLNGTHERLHSFLSLLPVSVVDHTRPASSLVRFAFMDEGLLSTTKFERYLAELEPLMRALGMFEVVYTALTELQFVSAERLFHRAFSAPVPDRQRGLGENWAVPTAASRAREAHFSATFSTLLFHYPYPPLLRNELQRSA